MRGLQLDDRWSSRHGEPLAGLPKCLEGAGQKEVSCAGLRGRVLAAAVPQGGAVDQVLDRPHPPGGACGRAHVLVGVG
jgi:hypothetical protein